MESSEMKRGSSKLKMSIVRNKKIILIFVVLILVLGCGFGAYLLKASEKPAFCASCHIMKPYFESWEDSHLLANVHAQNDVTCHDCHDESLSEKVQEGITYVTGNYEIPLDELEFSRESCLECHTDFEEVVVANTEFEMSNPHKPPHYDDMECNLCHSMHKESELLCAECHSFDWQNDLNDSWVK